MIFEKINVTDLAVIIVLGIALILAIYYRMNELSMSIASGMIGYIGGASRMAAHSEKKNMEESRK